MLYFNKNYRMCNFLKLEWRGTAVTTTVGRLVNTCRHRFRSFFSENTRRGLCDAKYFRDHGLFESTSTTVTVRPFSLSRIVCSLQGWTQLKKIKEHKKDGLVYILFYSLQCKSDRIFRRKYFLKQ